MPVAVGDAIEPAAFFYLTPEPDWLGRQDKRGASPTLVRMLAAVGQNGLDDAQIIPVSVFWGQSPDSESRPLEAAVRRQLGGHRAPAQAGAHPDPRTQDPCAVLRADPPARAGGTGQDHERTLRMVNRILRVHFRNLKTAVIGPDLSHRHQPGQGLLRAPLVRQAISEECERTDIPGKAEGIALRYANEIASDFSIR